MVLFLFFPVQLLSFLYLHQFLLPYSLFHFLFQQYLELNNIEIETEKDFNNVIIQYMLDMKMQNGLRVLEYYRRNNKTYDEIISALQDSVCGVFKVDKILSNAYETTCLSSNTQMTLIPMVKMNHLKQIGKFDYICARIIELDNVQYILEIYDVISEFDVARATSEAIRYMLQNPKIAHYKNEAKKIELEKSATEFYEKFKRAGYNPKDLHIEVQDKGSKFIVRIYYQNRLIHPKITANNAENGRNKAYRIIYENFRDNNKLGYYRYFYAKIGGI